MLIGDMQQFMRAQQLKVEQRQEEMKKIKKGIYQMQVKIDSQNMDTFIKECDKNDKKTVDTKTESEKEGSEKPEQKMVDIKAEMEKMMSMSKIVF